MNFSFFFCFIYKLLIKIKQNTMLAIYRFLFPSKPDGITISLLLLALRILFGGLLLSHGIQKWNNYAEMSAVFLIRWEWGVMCRWGLLSLVNLPARSDLFWRIISSGNDTDDIYYVYGFFVIHGSDPFAVKELAFVYLVVFILMYITGPGKFSIDRFISVPLSKKRR